MKVYCYSEDLSNSHVVAFLEASVLKSVFRYLHKILVQSFEIELLYDGTCIILV